MPTLPAFDITKNVNHSPHVVILGAGASKAAFPRGDANGRRVPVMAELTDCLDLRTSLKAAGFEDGTDFESVYDELASSGRSPSLVAEIDSRLRVYFETLVLPERPTLYDYLLLSLRDKDLIATFNWDPFLPRAFIRNRDVASLPQMVFLHGNVEIAMCDKDLVKGFRGQLCMKCGSPLQPTRLLYPVRDKNYKSDPFIANEWSLLEDFLRRCYMLTIFGYGAPFTDAAAVELMTNCWGQNPTFELGQVNIVDIKSRKALEETWKRFFCRNHYACLRKLSNTWIFRHPRRSCEALAMATLQQAPWRDNPIPEFKTLSELHAWIGPLTAEEHLGQFSGKPCANPPAS
jgi:hypothetical protein